MSTENKNLTEKKRKKNNLLIIPICKKIKTDSLIVVISVDLHAGFRSLLVECNFHLYC